MATSESNTPLIAKRLNKKSPLQTNNVKKAKEEAANTVLK